MDWSIQEIARLAGTTSRTLRHYGDVGLLPATRLGANGYRYYDAAALVRLQRIVMLRQLGLSLPAIAAILDGQTDDAQALSAHLHWLRAEAARVASQIASVEQTIRTLKKGEELMAENMFNGFDSTVHRSEVVERWGETAYNDSNDWWRAKSAEEKEGFQRGQAALAADWVDAAAHALDPESDAAQALARRQYDWLRVVPGTPGYPNGPTREYFVGLGELYVADARFGEHYGAGAEFVRDALAVFAAREL